MSKSTSAIAKNLTWQMAKVSATMGAIVTRKEWGSRKFISGSPEQESPASELPAGMFFDYAKAKGLKKLVFNAILYLKGEDDTVTFGWVALPYDKTASDWYIFSNVQALLNYDFESDK